MKRFALIVSLAVSLAACGPFSGGPTPNLKATEDAIRAQLVATMTAGAPAPTATFTPATALLLPDTPTPLPTDTPATPTEPTASPMPATYTVQTGDNLSKIASRLGISVAVLAAYNNISDPSKISVGQVLQIPPAEYVPPTTTPLPAMTETPTPASMATPEPVPTEQPTVPAEPSPTPQPTPTGQPNVQITSILYDGAVYRVESDEYAVIGNLGDSSQDMTGWRVNAGDRGQDYVFPAGFVLGPGQQCRLYTNEVHEDSCAGGTFGSGKAIWNNDGDCGYLFDATGQLVSQQCY